jgi:23S rRNA (cytidine1920-2'-O)/16S rRNA (cytidine1409-2'-O)-methyltransferase
VPKKKVRIDELMVAQKLAPDITTARAYILAGSVRCRDEIIDKVGSLLPLDASLVLHVKKFVGRGAQKLIGAMNDFNIEKEFLGRIVLDVGASTGGFTQACLKSGALKVFALDVGFNQLDWSLKTDDRVISMEKTDIREIDPEQFKEIDWIVVDVSFIPIRKVWEALANIMKTSGARMLLLIKPQFELPKEDVPAGGVISNPGQIQMSVKQVVELIEFEGFGVATPMASQVKGRYGNQEFFILVQSLAKVCSSKPPIS